MAVVAPPHDVAGRVLMIGGTQFLGRHTVRALLDADYEVTVLSRGRTRFPFEGEPRATHVRCNRSRAEFREWLSSARERFDATVDFCAYAPDDVRPVIDVLGERAGLYIFISTDSVYMASDPDRFERERGRLTEASAVRPADARRRAERASNDEYGSLKLEAEELLARASAADARLRWTALRLPDAFGPFENTGRQASLVRRLRKGGATGLRVEGEPGAGAHRAISLVYGPDVGAAVVAACRSHDAVHGRALNICAYESPTWEGFVRALATALDAEVPAATRAAAAAAVSVPAARFAPERDTQFLSTDFGPLSVALATRVLPRWTPTVLEEAVRQTARWENERAAARGRKRPLPSEACTPVDAA